MVASPAVDAWHEATDVSPKWEGLRTGGEHRSQRHGDGTDNGIAEGHWRRLHTQRRMEKRDTTLSQEDKKVEERRGDESRSN